MNIIGRRRRSHFLDDRGISVITKKERMKFKNVDIMTAKQSKGKRSKQIFEDFFLYKRADKSQTQNNALKKHAPWWVLRVWAFSVSQPWLYKVVTTVRGHWQRPDRQHFGSWSELFLNHLLPPFMLAVYNAVSFISCMLVYCLGVIYVYFNEERGSFHTF